MQVSDARKTGQNQQKDSVGVTLPALWSVPLCPPHISVVPRKPRDRVRHLPPTARSAACNQS